MCPFDLNGRLGQMLTKRVTTWLRKISLKLSNFTDSFRRNGQRTRSPHGQLIRFTRMSLLLSKSEFLLLFVFDKEFLLVFNFGPLIGGRQSAQATKCGKRPLFEDSIWRVLALFLRLYFEQLDKLIWISRCALRSSELRSTRRGTVIGKVADWRLLIGHRVVIAGSLWIARISDRLVIAMNGLKTLFVF